MPRLRSLLLPVNLLGQSVPRVALLLAALPLVCSVASAVLGRDGTRLIDLFPLSPRLVMHGQAWRLFTWPLVELNALSLFFAALVLLWCARDLAYAWGPGRLLLHCAGLAAASGAGTTLVGLVWPRVYDGFYLAVWALADALIVAWALLFPHRPILFMFVLRVSGMQIVWTLLALLTLMALLDGPAAYVPHYVAVLLSLAYVGGESPRALWLRLRYRLIDWRRRHGRGRLRAVQRPGPDRWRH